MRDRLVDLINEAKDEYPTIPTVNCCKPTFAYYLAGRLLANGVFVPPCKVGDTVYAIACWHGRYVIRDVEVCNYTIFENDWKIVDLYGDYWSANNLGKTFFRTREEAEQALKGEHHAEIH